VQAASVPFNVSGELMSANTTGPCWGSGGGCSSCSGGARSGGGTGGGTICASRRAHITGIWRCIATWRWWCVLVVQLTSALQVVGAAAAVGPRRQFSSSSTRDDQAQVCRLLSRVGRRL
jgi:hypothetical protein